MTDAGCPLSPVTILFPAAVAADALVVILTAIAQVQHATIIITGDAGFPALTVVIASAANRLKFAAARI